MHLPLPEPKTERARQTSAVIAGVLLVFTAVLAAIGLADPNAACIDPKFSVVDRIYRFFLLFDFGGEGLKVRECFPSPLLEVARFTGPAGVLTGVAALLWGLAEDLVANVRLRAIRQHVVVIGMGDRGWVLARGAAKTSRVIGVDLTAPKGPMPQRCDSVLGDGRETRTLKRAGIGRARYAFAATNDDLLNLQIARGAGSLGCGDVYALVGDAFAQRLADNPNPAPVNAISLDEIAARTLAGEARFHELADLQGHAQVHLVVFGDAALAAAVIAQTVRTALAATLGEPIVTLLAADPEQARKAVLRSYPGLEKAARLIPLRFDPVHDILDQPELFGQISAVAPVSAVVVIDPVTDRACLFAGALQGALRRAEAWAAPIFFSAAPVEAAAPFASRLETTPRLSDVLHPFETGLRLCTPENVAHVDEAARKLHESYLRAHAALRARSGPPSEAVGALVEWKDLAPTFRQANRRAADHVAAKLLSAGCFSPPGPLRTPEDLDLLAGGRLEDLAELEHRAWMADRLLAGWRQGPARNERARIHECLRPYDQLPEATRDLDRAQIRDLFGPGGLPRGGSASSSDPGLTRLGLWVGLIGALDLKADEGEWVAEAAAAQLDALMLDHPGRHLTLATPLAPGADLVMARALLAHAAARDWPHRLVVVEALPAHLMLADFESRWRDGAPGDPEVSAATWPEAVKALAAARNALIAQAPDARVVEIMESAAGGADHQGAYRRQNAYLVRRCDTILAAVHDRGGKAAGGTAEALRWRADPTTMPASETTIPLRPRDESAPVRSAIVLDLGAREIV